MPQTKSIIAALKRELRKQGKTYRDIANVLNLSEASVKRLFSEHAFTLDRLDRICEILGIEINDLVRLMEQAMELTTHLTLQQEEELVSDIKLLLMAHCLINKWTFPEVIENYKIAELEGIQLLARLDRMKIIQLLPGNSVKLLISKDFEWIEHGPIQRFYEDKVQSEFFDSSFLGAGEYRMFQSGMLTRTSNLEMIRRLKRVVREFNDINSEDEMFPMSERSGTSVLIAIRPWGVKVFESLRKNKTKKPV